ncbi:MULTISPECIES: molybdate ABC transporter substrate-binding protein [Caulobacter]|jgi:molybdate transport system substrate-binding protein|uniref:Molybdenum ABC transporter, periplasmic molybdate-binding protein n=1 Tax=Caulobacter vibrioides OR37 TaxID=1292034 RepID=R0CZZ8_CAUVI|nr:MULTISPECIES: molybdate ABC transporter substrate-binding protein [Caulobacter]ENZ82021.1 molybdenum ABC transporter, periplasmic molybdate-binding protein [Caulobacter vibrioides OR37]MBQ1560964.1 molybdate ABC transporter substrate-binding protein [Caulobacter sp.]
MIARRPMLIAAIAGVLSLALGGAALAGETKVAVAANFTDAAKEIAARFKAKTGHEANLSFGSSGQFYAQIANGAPFEVFLSADAERPLKAEAEGLAVPGSRFTYATGRLVLYSKTPGLVDGKGAVLKTGKFEKLSIADPKTAPYGEAAVETLTKLKLYDALKPKIVQGSSITQAFQYVQTGAAELGFVALSQVINEPGGSRWLVPAADHAPIDQQAVLLKTGEKSEAARAFLAFLKGPEAKAIIRRYGYEAR